MADGETNVTILQHFINGERVAGKSNRFGDICNPTTGHVQAQVPFATAGPNIILGRFLWAIVLVFALSSSALAQNVHNLPLFMPADAYQQGFVRIINDSANAGTVRVHAIDDEGERFGPVELPLDAWQSTHFSSEDLENGNPDKEGLSRGVGDGSGYWRLELYTDLDIEVLAYIRTPQGFLTGVHDVVEGASMRWRVHFFNPASNLDKESLLRVINASGIETEVEIRGTG